MSSLLIQASAPINLDGTEMFPGIPSGVSFGNLPDPLGNLLGRKGSFYVPCDQAYSLAAQVTEVHCCDTLSFRSEVLRNRQLAYWLTTECSKRHEYTNRVFRTKRGKQRGANGFPMIDVTPEDAQRSYEEEMDKGMISLWTATVSSAGMYTIQIAPLEYARLLVEGNILMGRCARLHENGHHFDVGMFSASVPFGRHQFMDGRHTYANAVADHGLCISVDFGDGYPGRLKKTQMGAHMVFLKRKGQFVLHMGVGEEIGMLGSSGVGKSQVVEPEPPEIAFRSALKLIRDRYPEADFSNIRGDEAIIIEGEKTQRVRTLIIDDIAAVFIDPSNGSMWVYCLEAGYYLRVDQWKKKGIIPVVDRMAYESNVQPDDAIWSNIGVKDGVPEMGNFTDAEGATTNNPRVSVRKSAYGEGEYLSSSDDERRPLKHLIAGTAAGTDDPMFWPACSILSLPQLIALAGASFRTKKGTQSFSATGSGAGWTADAGFTQAQFTALGPAQVTEDVVSKLRHASPHLACYGISQRASTMFTQPGLYDALFTLRKIIEAEGSLEKYRGKRLPGKYWGWTIRHPDIDPRITDPFETVPSDVLVDCARRFDNMIMRYWIEILGKEELSPETQHYVRNLITADMPSEPTKKFDLMVA